VDGLADGAVAARGRQRGGERSSGADGGAAGRGGGGRGGAGGGAERVGAAGDACLRAGARAVVFALRGEAEGGGEAETEGFLWREGVTFFVSSRFWLSLLSVPVSG